MIKWLRNLKRAHNTNMATGHYMKLPLGDRHYKRRYNCTCGFHCNGWQEFVGHVGR